MSKVASENVISGKETLEETPVDLEVVKDNLEEISKKVQNIENRLSEEQENIGNIRLRKYIQKFRQQKICL